MTDHNTDLAAPAVGALRAAATQALLSLRAAQTDARSRGHLNEFHYRTGTDIAIKHLEEALEPFHE